jgi:hypothetical protein
MSITAAKIQVLPASTDNTSFNITGQVITNGLTSSEYAMTGLTFNPSSNTLTANTISVSNINLTNGYTVGYINVPQNAQTSSYSLSLSDQSKAIYLTLNSSNTTSIYIPSTVPFPLGTAIAIVTNGSFTSNVIANAGVTMYLAGNTAGTISNTRTLAGYSMASLLNVGPNIWYISGVGIT